MKEMIRKNYHWIVAATVFLHLGIFVGFGNAGGLFILPVAEELGISRTAYALAATTSYNLCSCVVQILSGPVYKRLGYRKMVGLGLPMAIVSYLIIATSQNMVGLCIGSILRGAVLGLCATTTANRLINDWFHRHRGFVWGVLAAVTGLGGSVWCLVLPQVIQGFSWRSGYVLAAILVSIVYVLNVLFIRNRPEDMKLAPYGEGVHVQKKRSMENSFQGYTFQELVRKPIFYLTLIMLLVIYISLYLPNSVMVAHMCDRGFSDTQAAQMQSVLLFALAGSKVFLGWLMDRIGVRKVAVICCLCTAVSMLLLPTVSGYSYAMGVVILYGTGLPLSTIIVPALTLDLFGYQSFTTAVGIFSAMVSAGSMLAGPISNGVFDRLGSYTLAFQAGAILMLAMVVMLGLICRQADRMRKQITTEQTAL
jgi:MFS family permease